MDADNSSGLIVAATNHPDLLNRALFRRFDDVIEYALPTVAERIAIIRDRLAAFARDQLDLAALAASAAGSSQAQTARACDEAAKTAVQEGTDKISAGVLLAAFDERRLSCLPGGSPR